MPLNWKARIIKMAPVLPRPHTHMQPGYNVSTFRLALTDPDLLRVQEMRKELEAKGRFLGWMNARQ